MKNVKLIEKYRCGYLHLFANCKLHKEYHIFFNKRPGLILQPASNKGMVNFIVIQ
jgi:hypothetical protein